MLVIRLQTPNDPEPAWAVLNNKPADWQHGSWEKLMPLARGQDIVLLIPSRDVLLTQTSVNTRNQRQLQQAIPFALEDSIADELEQQHIVWQTRPASTQVDVAIIRRDRLREWVKALQAHQLRPQTVLPDLFALPWGEDTLTLWQQGAYIWVRTGELSGYASTPPALPLLLDSLTSGQTEPVRLRLYSDQTDVWAADQRFTIIPETQAEQLFPSSLQAALKLNLLNGLQDETRAQFRQHWQRWRLAAGLAAGSAIVAMVMYGVGSYRLQQQLEAIDAQNLQLFAELFPDVSDVDPRGLKSRLASELVRIKGKGSATATTTSPLPQLAAVAAAMQAAGDLSVEDIRAQTGTLTVNLQAKNQQAIETLRDTLEKSLGNAVEMQSSRTADSVKATLTLGGQS
ncbi:MAG: type II secretion system protein GspL [Candidatus Thiothrix putei]|uniref:Type II secretion system protein L n=1 Tax=Candidatus Thiothrix putei TaxID=3080811 RepID=A0AA95HFB4_9GAMM|nr:MAG: type II secretion system protein GspL [Candidatus Thiothrix putei]